MLGQDIYFCHVLCNHQKQYYTEIDGYIMEGISTEGIWNAIYVLGENADINMTMVITQLIPM